MPHRDGGAPVQHRELALEDDVADHPPPSWNAVVEGERLELTVSGGIHGAARPLVGCQPDPRVAHDEHRIERREAEHALAHARVAVAVRRAAGDHQQAVVAAGAQPCDGAHRVAAEAVGHEPLALGGLGEAPAHLASELDHHQTRLLVPSSPRDALRERAPSLAADGSTVGAERLRLQEAEHGLVAWKRWGPVPGRTGVGHGA